MKRLYSTIIVSALMGCGTLCAQGSTQTLEKQLKEYFAQYQTEARANQPQLKEVRVDSGKKTVSVVAGGALAYQPFTPQSVKKMYADIRGLLPSAYKKYTLHIYSGSRLIDDLVPNALRTGKKDSERLTLELEQKGEPWVTNTSRPYEPTKGLQGRHIMVWQSHGRFYKNERSQWEWQRPNVFCTNEDLFTQSFVVPFVIPMLQNAGAYVYTPRERDSQRHEVIVDNDTKGQPGYVEQKSHRARWTTAGEAGFAQTKSVYHDGENPFESGTARFVRTERKENRAFAEWVPSIPESGEYAVYVSYQTLPSSVQDARYIVFHEGGVTEFKVNQKIGGGTWVYLGTFRFRKGSNATGMVVLSNYSEEKGVVCADAVRFGGGMGNIERGGSVSGLPRNLEGARYSAQWGGMPYSVYGGKNGENDYADDINVRSNVLNYLSGGSVYNPTEEGLGVPFELSLAIHSDAGVSKQDEQIGTLGIYTTDFNDGKLNAGTSRMASRDLADLMLTQIKSDVQATFGQAWTRRGLWDRNYSETRLPGVPSAIVEMLSHQNFADMRYGHDPVFKFTVGRAIYKATLKFISEQHGRDYVVQPLPVSHFAISRRADDEFLLTWKAENDPTEPTAKPKEYIVYTAEGNNAFDNGVRVKDCHHTAKLKPGEVYSFRVSAVNAGGESFPSETLTAYKAPNEKACVLIVNGFHRLSGPAQVNTATTATFDIEQDPGVAYMSNQSYCGAQLVTDRAQAGRDGETGLGYSGSELEGLKIAGNTLDYPYTHGRAIAAAGGYSFTSCCNEAIEDGTISLTDYKLVDYICGLEKDSPANMKFSKSFTQQMQQALTAYCATGGGLMVSGAYIGSDMTATDAQREWTAGTLRYSCTGRLTDKNISEVDGMGMKLSVPRTVNERVYAVTTADCLLPVGDAFTAMVYGNGESAATAYDGNYRVFAMGFPFECIEQESGRNTLMAAVLRFLLKH